MADSLGSLIARRRRQLGLSQVELQQRAHLPSSSVISRAEKDQSVPTMATMRAIARALGAEGTLMPAYMRLLKERAERSASDLVVASTPSLLAAPVAMIEHEEVTLTTIVEPPPDHLTAGSGAAVRSLHPADGIIKEHRVDCAVHPSQPESHGRTWRGVRSGIGSFVSAVLLCEYSTDGVDVLRVRTDDDASGPERVSLTDAMIREREESIQFQWSAIGNVAEALLASGQLSCRDTGSAQRNRQHGGTAYVVFEPLTSRVVEREKPLYSNARDEARSRRLSTELQFSVASEADLRRSADTLASVLRQVSSWSDKLSAYCRLQESQLPASVLDAVADLFATSPEIVRSFIVRANPRWRMFVSPAWLDAIRAGSRRGA